MMLNPIFQILVNLSKLNNSQINPLAYFLSVNLSKNLQNKPSNNRLLRTQILKNFLHFLQLLEVAHLLKIHKAKE
jgi:hypothetical protein